MGSFWESDNSVRYYLLPKVDFREIRWLRDTNKVDILCDSVVLDALEERTGYYRGLIKGHFVASTTEFMEYLTCGINKN